jgi:uncharacterized protein (DUF4415 family)
MITSKNLSDERLKEIKNYPITYDEDSPKLSAEEIRKGAEIMRQRREKVMVSVRLEKHTADFYQQLGKGYTSIISRILTDIKENHPDIIKRAL